MATNEPPIVFIPLKEKITRDEIFNNIKDNQGKAYFLLKRDWYNIHTTDLFNTMERIVEDAYLLMDLNFKPMSVDGSDIIFLVTVNNTAEFILGGEAEDED